MPSIYFHDEHDAFRRTVRRFLEEEVAPHADEWEAQGRIPREIYRRMGDLGFLGITVPEAYGGTGADLFYAVAFLEELPRSMMGGFCAAVSVQQFMAHRHILLHGSEELKRRYVIPSVEGRRVGALAITEPDTGSDVAAIRTRALRDGDSYVVTGAKTFITNGAGGDFFTLAVRTGSPRDGAGGISLLVVDADTPGVTVSRRLRKMGWHSSDSAELVFEEVRVPASRLIGGEDAGFSLILDAFPLERLCAAAIAVGSADLALEIGQRYMAGRTAFGRPIGRFQALRHRVADIAAEIEAARRLTHHCAWLIERGEPAVKESSMAKLLATELGKRAADECLQFHGGYGYMEEYPVARLFRDARAATLAAGTSEIMREIISRILLEEMPADPTPRPPPEPPRSPEGGAGGPRPGPPAEIPRTVEALMRSLPSRLRPEKAEGWAGTLHFTIRDAARPEWTVAVAGGRCTVSEGLLGEPTCAIAMREKTYLGIADGTVNPQVAFMTGKVKVSHLGEMTRFLKAFRPPGA